MARDEKGEKAGDPADTDGLSAAAGALDSTGVLTLPPSDRVSLAARACCLKKVLERCVGRSMPDPLGGPLALL